MLDIYTKTLEKLQGPNVNLTKVANETGVKKRWLSYVASGKYTDPGVRKIQKLYNYFYKE